MDFRSLLTPLLTIFTFFVLLFLYTNFAGPIPFSVSSVTTNKTDTFNVTGEGKAVVVPDLALVSVGIQAEGNTVAIAQDEINKVITKASSAVKQLGVDEKDIQTTNYNISPKMDFREGSQKITGYSATTNLSIKVKDIEKVNSVIDAATANGANQVGGVTFDIADKTTARNKAREEAVKDAREKAQQAAKIAGFRLGRIVNYQEDFAGSIPPMPFNRVTMDSKEAGVPTQVESGSNEIKVSVTLSYDIE